MGSMQFFRVPRICNPACVVVLCLILAITTLFVMPPDDLASASIFFAIALMVAVIRPIYNKHTKSVCYLLLGMTAYGMFGNVFISMRIAEGFSPSVLLSLSAAGVLVALVTYMEGRASGAIFAGGSLMILFFAGQDAWSIATSVLIFLSAYTINHFIAKITGPENFVKNVLLSSLGSGAFIYLAGMFTVISGDIFSFTLRLRPSDVLQASVSIILVSVGISFVSLGAIDWILAKAGSKRFVEEEEGVMFGSIEPQPGKLPKEAEKRGNKKN